MRTAWKAIPTLSRTCAHCCSGLRVFGGGSATSAGCAEIVGLRFRSGLLAGGKWIRTNGPPPEIVVDPSGSRRDHGAKCGCLSARPRVRCLCPPGKTQHLLPKSVFDRPGSDRWNLASTTFPDARPMIPIRFPPEQSHTNSIITTSRTGPRSERSAKGQEHGRAVVNFGTASCFPHRPTLNGPQ